MEGIKIGHSPEVHEQHCGGPGRSFNKGRHSTQAQDKTEAPSPYLYNFFFFTSSSSSFLVVGKLGIVKQGCMRGAIVRVFDVMKGLEFSHLCLVLNTRSRVDVAMYNEYQMMNTDMPCSWITPPGTPNRRTMSDACIRNVTPHIKNSERVGEPSRAHL